MLGKRVRNQIWSRAWLPRFCYSATTALVVLVQSEESKSDGGQAQDVVEEMGEEMGEERGEERGEEMGEEMGEDEDEGDEEEDSGFCVVRLDVGLVSVDRDNVGE
ncbi:MAG: hypothetical protein Q9188_004387 [Gyalolechia gomerana]